MIDRQTKREHRALCSIVLYVLALAFLLGLAAFMRPAPAPAADAPFGLATDRYCFSEAAAERVLAVKHISQLHAAAVEEMAAGACVIIAGVVVIEPLDWRRHVFVGPEPFVILSANVLGETAPVWVWMLLGGEAPTGPPSFGPRRPRPL